MTIFDGPSLASQCSMATYRVQNEETKYNFQNNSMFSSQRQYILGHFATLQLSFTVLLHFLSTQYLDNQPTLRAAFRDSRDILLRCCFIFVGDCIISCVERLNDFCVFLWRLRNFLCGEVA